MANVKMMGPPDGIHNSIIINGRAYTYSPGTPVSVPDFDADKLESNGWMRIAPGTAGTTAQRPASPKPGDFYLDTTVGALLRYSGAIYGWVHHSTGAVAQ